MGYTTQASIAGEISQPWLNAGLDDDGSGEFNTTILAQIIADCSNRLDSYLSGIYNVPFPAPYPPKAMEYTLMFCCEEVYRRRLQSTSEVNPYKSICDGYRELLKLMAEGTISFDVGVLTAFIPGVVNVIPMALDRSLI